MFNLLYSARKKLNWREKSHTKHYPNNVSR